MTRVLHVIGSLDRGGAETVLVDLIRRDHSAEHHVLCWSGRTGVLAPQVRTAGGRVLRAAPGGQLARLRALRGLIAGAEGGGGHYDVVVSHVSLASAFILAAARTAPVRVARMHSAGDDRGAGPIRRAYRATARLLLPWSATHVLGVSQAAVQFATAGVRPCHRRAGTTIARLGNGVDTDRFRPHPEGSAAESAATVEGVATVLHVGRASPEKNRALLVPLFDELRRRRRVRMRLIGANDSTDLGRVPDDPSFEVTGPRDDIERAIARADVLVLPSLREGLPGVVLEALCCGVPVVASDLPTLRELTAVLTGITLVPVEAPVTDWADAVEAQLGRSARERAALRTQVLAAGYGLDTNVESWRALWPR